MTTNEDPSLSLSAKPSATSNVAVKGSAFVADLDSADFKSGVLQSRAYWVGVLPQCPVGQIDCAGVSFPKLSETVTQDQSGRTVRIPHVGAITRLTRSAIEKMTEKMPGMVVRFTEPYGLKDERGEPRSKGKPGPNENLQTHLVKRDDGSTMILPSRKGHMIRIPSAADVQAARDADRHINLYTRKELDEPAARYMFAVLCEDQNNPTPGAFYPDVLENTGLEWPQE